MSLGSKIAMVLSLLVALAAIGQVIGFVPTFALAALMIGMWIHSVGWRRAIFPFVAHLRGHE